MLNLKFDGNLIFCGFLPETKGNFIEFNLKGKNYPLLLFLSKRNKQLSDLDISNIPTDAEQLKSHLTLHCNSLSVEIQLSDIDPDILSALEAGQPTEKVKLLKQEIFDVALIIHGRIIDYFRNVKKQYWLEPLNLDSRNFESFLDECDIAWLDSRAEWKKFPRNLSQTIYFNVILHDKNQGVNEKDGNNYPHLSHNKNQQKCVMYL
jgi:hypothetical protein